MQKSKGRLLTEIGTVIGIVVLGFISLTPAKSQNTTMKLDHGNLVYTGAVINHKFAGQGKLTVQSQGQYVGNFTDGRFQGLGTFTATKGWQMQSDFQNGQLVDQVKLHVGNKTYDQKILADGTLKNAH
ncbi:hypothetical protein [Periweissella ghanensis]|uniref:MORN repeat protein n=1 Tax=Periweissella ghanensis TaxID=467997 RepID=A0ABM8Z8G9_9LACO|nr:hypothetical protein [Periweissella ghanensis]MCM0600956.1 hypothetical protein [Periweissella ghanensis]CAH0417626.1 hypothetical protein WGH24286_00038 [Periweissella ghanensis]